MQQFSADPENPGNVFVDDGGRDELAVAGRHLTAMQTELQKTLKQQKNLAALGLAVSKINHDMRNILASAQLMSDRLVDVDDPLVKRFAPKLLRTIDRAVGYTTEVLSYGQASESAPRRRRLQLSALVEDVKDMLAIDAQSGVEFVIVCKNRTFVGDAVDIGRAVAHHPAVVGADVPIADVITHDDQDVWFLLLLGR